MLSSSSKILCNKFYSKNQRSRGPLKVDLNHQNISRKIYPSQPEKNSIILKRSLEIKHNFISNKTLFNIRLNSVDAKPEKKAEWKRIFGLVKPEINLLGLAGISMTAGVVATLALPKMLGTIIDVIGNNNPTYSLTEISLALSAAFVVLSIASFLRMSLISIVSERIIKRLRNDLFSNLIYQKIPFFDSNKTGDLINRLSQDCNTLTKSVTENILQGLSAFLQIVGGLSILTYMQPYLTLFMLAVIPPVAFLGRYLGKFQKKISKDLQNALSEATQTAEERLNSIRTVKAFVQEESEIQRYLQKTNNVYELAKKSAFASAGFFAAIHLIANVALLAVLWRAGTLVLQNQITIGDVTSFLGYSLFVMFSISRLGNFYSDLMKAAGASSRVFELLDLQNELQEMKQKQTVELNKNQSSFLEGKIEFQDLSFEYQNRQGQVLQQIQANVTPGQILAIAGGSGSGKTTLGNLLLGMYSPTKGAVKIDDVAIRQSENSNLPEYNVFDVRKQIGYVQQQSTLFSGTIAENVKYGFPEASNEQIIEACKASNCHDFIESFPLKYNTIIGPNGVGLSGGQIQRICMARALIKNPKILIFDEATSSLDSESEYLIQKAFDTFSQGKTVIIIAHRLSTIRRAHKILVLNQGRIEETGTYEELMKNEKGTFKQLVSLQQH